MNLQQSDGRRNDLYGVGARVSAGSHAACLLISKQCDDNETGPSLDV